MAVFSLPAGKTRHTTVYSSFKGVDFSSDTTKIDNARSPYAPNVVSDSGGYPQKRTGWRELQRVKAPVNGLFRTVLDGTVYWLAPRGRTRSTAFSRAAGSSPLCSKPGSTTAFPPALRRGGFFYLLTGGDYLRFDGQAAVPVSEVATVPTVTISRLPDGGGEVYESVNLLSPLRTDSFLCDGTSKDYYLSSTDIDAVTAVLYDGKPCEISYTVDTRTGCVSFAQAPGAPLVTGQDNLRITYSKTVEGYADRIEKCRFGLAVWHRRRRLLVRVGQPRLPQSRLVLGAAGPHLFPRFELCQNRRRGDGRDRLRPCGRVSGHSQAGQRPGRHRLFASGGCDSQEGVSFPLAAGG